MAENGYTGEMFGPMRGMPLHRCDRHTAIWFHLGERCGVCVLEEKVKELERQLEQRCQECRKKGV